MIEAIKHNQFNVRLVRLFLAAIFIIALLYVYFLNNTIQAVVESKNNSKKIEAVNQEYQKIESQYFNIVGKIDIDYARQLGFVDQAQKADYLVRQGAVALR